MQKKIGPSVLAILLVFSLSLAAAQTHACAKFDFNITPYSVEPDGRLTYSGALTNCGNTTQKFLVVYKLNGPNNYYEDQYSVKFSVRPHRTLTEHVGYDAPEEKGMYSATVSIHSMTGALLTGPITKKFTVE